MKQLNSPLGLALLAQCLMFYGLHYFKPDMSDGLLFINSLLIGFIVGLIRYVTLPVKSTQKNHPDLPAEALRTLRECLHHSQMTLYFSVMQPMLAAQFSSLVGKIISKKPNGEPFTGFDEKLRLLQLAFKQLTASHQLYNKRAFEDRDRALTMLVFLRILWQNQSVEALPDLLKSIPVKLYVLLRVEAYRLYDLALLFTHEQLKMNADFTHLFVDLEGFFRNQLNEPAPEQLVIKPIASNEAFSLPAVVPEQQNPLHVKGAVVSIAIDTVVKTDVQDMKPVEATITDVNYLPDFMSWLIKRIASGNKQFALDSQELVLCDSNQFDNKTVFLRPEVLAKYQSRSGIESSVLEHTLQSHFFPEQAFFIEKAGNTLAVFPCILDEPFHSTHSTPIIKGD